MPGYNTHPLSHVESIRRVLREYKPNSLFKELLQNANDAHASRVWFCVHDGLQSCHHPLLSAPGLIIVNDGPFEEHHKEGISYIGLSNRATDQSSIGRFGLGIKSLFHLCEGFFFLESTGKENLRGFLTPWHGTNPGEEYGSSYDHWWDTKDADWDKLHEKTNNILNDEVNVGQWFALAIPLRIKSQITGRKYLRNEFPGDTPQEFVSQLSKAFENKVPSIKDCLVFLPKIKEVTLLAGEDRILVQRKKEKAVYLKEFMEWTGPAQKSPVTEHQTSEHWPQVSNLLNLEQEPDKIVWKGGIAISISPKAEESAKLRIFWSVFLPVGDHPSDEAGLEGFEDDIHIFVHGYFFPNSQRTEVNGAATGFSGAGKELNGTTANEDSVKEHWNMVLATDKRGVLPMVVPVLKEMVKAQGFDFEKTKTLIHAISSTQQFYGLFQSAICQSDSFATGVVGKQFRWKRFNASKIPLLFPTLLENESDRQVVPTLFGNNPDRPIIIKMDPYLAPPKREDPYKKTLDWAAEDFTYFFDHLDKEEIKNESSAEYVFRLLFKFKESALTARSAWEQLKIFRVEDPKGGTSDVSILELEELSANGDLYSNNKVGGANTELIQLLPQVCPQCSIKFSSRDSSWIGITPTILEQSAFAALILSQSALGSEDIRLKVITQLLPQMEENERGGEAIRYLLHTNANQRHSVSTLFFEEPDGSEWNQIFKIALEKLGQPWRLLGNSFKKIFTPDNKHKIGLENCNPMGFITLCEGIDTTSWPLHDYHDFLMRSLPGNQESNEILRKLRIHKCGEDSWHTIGEDTALDAPISFEPGDGAEEQLEELKRNTKVVSRSSDPVIEARQTLVFEGQILDNYGLLERALKQDEAYNYSELILSILAPMGIPRGDIGNLLMKRNWLISTQSEGVSLDKLLWLEGAEEEIENLAGGQFPLTGGVFTKHQTSIDWEIPTFAQAWNTLRTFITQGKARALLEIGWGHSEKLCIGRDHFASFDQLKEWLEGLVGIESEIAPVIPLVRHLVNHALDAPNDLRVTQEFHAKEVANIFARPWEESPQRYDQVLDVLRQRHIESKGDPKDKVETVFHNFLRMACDLDRWDDAYRKQETFTLLNANGQWTPIGQLVKPGRGIAKEAVVHNDALNALALPANIDPIGIQEGVVARPAGRVEYNEDATAMRLEAYGQEVVNSVKGFEAKHWGVFMALLGGQGPIRDVADELNLNDGFGTDTIRQNFGLEPGNNGYNFHSMETVDGNTVQKVAINGSYFNAPLEVDDPLFVLPVDEEFFRHPFGNTDWVIFDLVNPKQLANFSFPRVRRAFAEVIQNLLHFLGREGDVIGFLDQVENAGQPILLRAQHEILDSFLIHATQLRVRPSQLDIPEEAGNQFQRAIDYFDEAKRWGGEAGIAQALDNHISQKANQRSAEAKLNGRNALRELFESGLGGPILDILYKSMKNRIEQAQYRPEAILFEMFQNADDALVEKDTLDGGIAPGIFVMEVQQEGIRIAHWGRMLNDALGAEGELRWGYERDLEKMLVLHGSNKQGGEGQEQVTGKFGLGFKSVYLATKSPEICSGNLQLKVHGAIYPKDAECNDLQEFLDTNKPAQEANPGTCINLPFSGDADQSICQRFLELAPYLAVFGKKVRQIQVIEGEDNHPIQWDYKQIPNPPDNMEVRFGKYTSIGQHRQNYMMEIKSSGCNISWLIGFSRTRFSELPKDLNVPVLWATTPLLHTKPLGFAINAEFDPNPGRTELGCGEDSESQNQKLRKEASAIIHDFLVWFARNGEIAMLSVLTEKQKLNVIGCWNNLWRTFKSLLEYEHSSVGTKLAIEAVWPQDGEGGYSGLIRHHPTLPNGFQNDLSRLTSVSQVKFVTSGFLDSPQGKRFLEDIYVHRDFWKTYEGSIATTLDPTEFLSGETLRSLKIAGLQDFEPEEVNTRFLLHMLFRDCRDVSIQIAKLLGKTLHEGIFEEEKPHEERYTWPPEERRELEKFLRELKFRPSIGEYAPAAMLLHPDGMDAEETRLAAIAPRNYHLHHEYPIEAIGFFRLCRGHVEWDANQRAQWIKEACASNDVGRINSSVDYLAKEDAIIHSVTSGLEKNTAQKIQQSEWFEKLGKSLQARVSNSIIGGQVKKDSTKGRPFVLNRIKIEDILECWEANAKKALRDFTISGSYRSMVFPDSKDLNDDELADLLRDTNSAEGKAAWFRFLCIGSCLSVRLGSDPLPRIKKFWQWLGRLGYWEKSQGFDSGFDKVFQVIDGSEEAELRRREYYDFQKIRHIVYEVDMQGWLLELARNQDVGGEELLNFLRQGVLPEAPFQERRRIRGTIGQSMSAPLLFVMRELRRLKVIQHDRFDPACYYINSPARRIMTRLGWLDGEHGWPNFDTQLEHSEICHDHLAGYQDLRGHFDLPLQCYAKYGKRG